MLTERIQAAIDRNVAGSPRARELLAQLEGRSLVVRMQFTPWRVRAQVAVRPTAGGAHPG